MPVKVYPDQTFHIKLQTFDQYNNLMDEAEVQSTQNNTDDYRINPIILS